jgi:hypothetical protein
VEQQRVGRSVRWPDSIAWEAVDYGDHLPEINTTAMTDPDARPVCSLMRCYRSPAEQLRLGLERRGVPLLVAATGIADSRPLHAFYFTTEVLFGPDYPMRSRTCPTRPTSPSGRRWWAHDVPAEDISMILYGMARWTSSSRRRSSSARTPSCVGLAQIEERLAGLHQLRETLRAIGEQR